MGNYLGQHFLKNKVKLREIVEALELKDGDVVIEIGPGHGELTNEIVLKLQSLKVENFKIIAIEKDREFASNLKEEFGNNKNIEIIEGDILKIFPEVTTNYKIVGNIPYYITGYLFRILGELEHKPELIVLLIQKEVAERVCAKKGDMNLLAASVQFWAEPKIIDYVSRNDFEPAPKVDSAIIKLLPVTSQLLSRLKCNKEKYYKFIKILFKQPRKTILNNLLLGITDQNIAILSDSMLSDRIAEDKKENELQIINKEENKKEIKEEIVEKLKKVGVGPNARPQNLSVERIIALSNS